jgi:hypothetical protein
MRKSPLEDAVLARVVAERVDFSMDDYTKPCAKRSNKEEVVERYSL